MSADVLRRAASAIRADHEPWVHANPDKPCDHPTCENNRFMHAVADWLETTAAEHESNSGDPTLDAFFAAFDTAPDNAAVAVARAYLGRLPVAASTAGGTPPPPDGQPPRRGKPGACTSRPGPPNPHHTVEGPAPANTKTGPSTHR